MSELYVSTPTWYVSRPGALKDLPAVLEKAFGNAKKKALLIWSATAESLIGNTVRQQLEKNDFRYDELFFKGYPSEKLAREYASIASEKETDFLIALGGGRVMDVVKAAGTFSGKRVVTVPTIAATCASWAAVSILYHEDGDFDRAFPNPQSPIAIVADTSVIGAAPARYLRAGIADTLAKWYEPDYKSSSFSIQLVRYGAELAFDFLKEKGGTVADLAEHGVINDDTVKAVDAIIFLAGVVGSFTGPGAYAGLAHPFYFVVRRDPDSYRVLHGEIVSFGLILQAIYEERGDEALQETLDVLESVHNLFTWEEMGLKEKDIPEYAARILKEHLNKGKDPAKEDVNRLAAAIRETDRVIRIRKGI